MQIYNHYRHIKKSNKMTIEELNNEIDILFNQCFIEFPDFIKEKFFNTSLKLLNQELITSNISSSKFKIFWFNEIDRFYPCLNFFLFQQEMLNYYNNNPNNEKFNNFLTYMKLNINEPILDGLIQLKVIRGFFHLLEPNIVFEALEKTDNLNFIDEILNLDKIKINDHETDNTKILEEKINILKNLRNF